MSTKIDDLPGPIPENIREDLTQIQNEMPSPIILDDNQSNIKVDIKKKVQFKDENDKIYTVEVRGSRDENNIYFSDQI